MSSEEVIDLTDEVPSNKRQRLASGSSGITRSNIVVPFLTVPFAVSDHGYLYETVTRCRAIEI